MVDDPALLVSGGVVSGTVVVPGDKSISHRAALLAALANGPGRITGFLDADDTNRLLRALSAVGIAVEKSAPDEVNISGRGNLAWSDPDKLLDMGNSGTALRLLAGVLAGRGVHAVLTGDASLRARPMDRIVEPLRRMGAHASARDGRAPLSLGGGALRGVAHAVPVASAQVVSCLLFAGLHADGETTVSAPPGWRDHTERLLAHYGIAVATGRGGVSVSRCDWDAVAGRPVAVPGDPSSAAFFACAAALVPGAEVRLPGLCANPARTGFVAVLRRMGADCGWHDERESCGEPVADLLVRGGALRAVRIGAGEVPALIDELPALVAVAAHADGVTRITGAAELRVKESDRLHAMAAALAALGADVREAPDGLEIAGGRLRGGTVDAHDDHRVAMALVVAASRAAGPVHIERAAAIGTSFPGFTAAARAAGLEVTHA